MLPLSFSKAPDEPLRVLCIGAHSDDIEIGAGGLVRRLIRERKTVDVHWSVFASSSPERDAEAEASAAWFLEGTREHTVEIHGFKESFFPARWEEIKDALFQTRAAFEPDLVLTHRLQDRHQDHRVLAELTWNTYRDHVVLAYEIAKYEGDLGQPNVYVPLTREDATQKAAALQRAFATQRSKPWFSEETFFALMRLRGIECNAPEGFAEGFHADKLIL
ncbi:MAG: PIG-L deacetylase family protein [Planctomycetota bacterium]